MIITIDPRIKFNYSSYYLYGILQLEGNVRIKYDIKPFIELSYKDLYEYNCGMAFLLDNQYKIIIDFGDIAHIDKVRYEWCDIYAKVNPTADQVKSCAKLLAIGPGFGISLYTMSSLFIKGLWHFYKGFRFMQIPLRIFLRDYLYTYVRRRKLLFYETPSLVRNNYIFHASTLWYNKFAATDTNMYRGEFLKACKRAGVEIEGGLFYVNGTAVLEEMPDYPKYKEKYKDFIYESRLSIDDYIKKTKESAFVFNTPSVCECHGWKLAEYLCMGKAIISTPLKREMPEELVHGKNIHFVASIDEIYDAVVKINSDDVYRRKLEQGARAYYEEWLSPQAVIKRLFEKVEAIY